MGRSGGGGGSSEESYGESSGGGFSGGSRSSGGFSGGSSGRSGRSGGYSSEDSYRGSGRSSHNRHKRHKRHNSRDSYESYDRHRDNDVDNASLGYGSNGDEKTTHCVEKDGSVLGFLLSVLMVFLILAIYGMLSQEFDSTFKSTVQREAISGVVHETKYYQDDASWIGDAHTMTEGMRNFYHATGVQPFVYIIEEYNGDRNPSVEELQKFAEQKYDELFTDEGHFLLVFCDNGEGSYNCGYTVGSRAKTIMDSEAIGILANYLDRYYTSDMSDEEFFSTVFDKTAESIMTVTSSNMGIIAECSVLLVITIVIALWWKRRSEQKKREAEQLQDILNTPLEKFGSDEAENLAKKYEKKG